MNRCERESEVVAALRAGSWTDELSRHVLDCPGCAETEHVARPLLGSAAAMHAGHEPAAADLVWRQAQARMREMALKRATRPLIVMRRVSAAAVALFGLWAVRAFWGLLAGNLQAMDGWGWAAAGSASTEGIGVATALLLIGAGSLCLLYVGRRNGGAMPSA
jgi:hypothetical protein